MTLRCSKVWSSAQNKITTTRIENVPKSAVLLTKPNPLSCYGLKKQTFTSNTEIIQAHDPFQLHWVVLGSFQVCWRGPIHLSLTGVSGWRMPPSRWKILVRPSFGTIFWGLEVGISGTLIVLTHLFAEHKGEVFTHFTWVPFRSPWEFEVGCY